ncbi:hypothetical protein ACHWQZ_G017240 [Mnemiopsis leidyi]
MGKLTRAKELVLRLEDDVKKLTSEYEKESCRLEDQIKETHSKMVLPTSQASPSRTTVAPYRNKKLAPSDTYARNRRAGTWTTTPQGDGRRATERFYTGILTGPQSRSLAKGAAIRNATLKLAMAEVAEQHGKSCHAFPEPLKRGKHLTSGPLRSGIRKSWIAKSPPNTQGSWESCGARSPPLTTLANWN